MKKFIAYLLAICISCSLLGCNRMPAPDNNVAPPAGDDTTQFSEPTDPSYNQVVTQAPMVSVYAPVVSIPTKLSDGTVIFNHTTQYISLTHPDPDVADKVITDFLNRIHVLDASVSTIEAAAKESIQSSSVNPYLSLTAFDPIRVDHSILSFYGRHATYTGTTHPETVYHSVNYDLVTGSPLELTDILTENASADTLYKYIIESLSSQEMEKSLRGNYKQTVKAHFSNNLNKIEDWYLSTTGLCFFFQPYEIAPYASGCIIAEIPYHLLTGTLNDAYFPAERDTASGVVSTQNFDANDTTQFTQFAELSLDENGDNALLYTDTSVHNIRIEIGEWSASGIYYTPQYTIFAAYGLTPGDAILVEAEFESTLPRLRLSYQTNAGTNYFYIIKGANNTIELIPC